MGRIAHRTIPLFAAVLAGAVLGQRTWIVDTAGGADFDDVPAAVAAAAAGDTIHVASALGLPAHWDLTLTKGLTILGDARRGAEVVGHLVVADLPAGQRVVLRALGLAVAEDSHCTVAIARCVGTVLLDHVVLDGVHGSAAAEPALAVTACNRVHLYQTQLTGAPGLAAADAGVTAVSCWIGGAFVVTGPGVTAPAAAAQRSELACADTTFVGGSNFDPGDGAGPGCSGLELAGTAATLARCVVYGGRGSAGTAASLSFDTLARATVDAATVLPDGTAGAGTLRRGETGALLCVLEPDHAAIELVAAPRTLAVVLLAMPGPGVPLPFGTWWLAGTGVPVAAGLAPVERTLPVPAFLPRGMPFALQGVVWHAFAARTSPPLVLALP